VATIVIAHRVYTGQRKDTHQKVQKNTISRFANSVDAKPVTHKYSYENK